jgi:hypothetical protein
LPSNRSWNTIAKTNAPPDAHPRRPEGEVWIVDTVTISLDGPSRRIVRWQAKEHFDSNLSAALRAIIINSVPPSVIGATGGPKRWTLEPW